MKRVQSLFKSKHKASADDEGMFFYASGTGDVPKIKEMLEKGVDIDKMNDKLHHSGIQEAAQKGRMEAVKFFVENGASLKGALMCAVGLNHEEVARYLVVQGADVNEPDEMQHTPLWSAAHWGFSELCKLLVLAGASTTMKGQASFRWIEQHRAEADATKAKNETAMTTPLEEALCRHAKDNDPVVTFLRDEAPALEAQHKKSKEDDSKESTGGKKMHILLSYNWDTQELAKKVRAELGRRGFDIWFDIEQIHGSTLASMAEAVENAAAVLCCMSQKYQDSQNCRLEAEYSLQQNKPIIPLLFQDKWKPSGWLGMLLGAKLYFDFSNAQNFDNMIAQVVRECERHSKRGAGTIVAAPTATVSDKSVEVKTWNADKLAEWLQSAGESEAVVEKFKSQDMDGVALWELWLMRRENHPDFTPLLRDLGLEKVGAQLRFTSSLRTLLV